MLSKTMSPRLRALCCVLSIIPSMFLFDSALAQEAEPAHLATDITAEAPADGQSLALDDVSGFDPAGGDVEIEPDTSSAELVSYQGVSTETNELTGITRARPLPHAQGAVIVPIGQTSPSASPSPSEPVTPEPGDPQSDSSMADGDFTESQATEVPCEDLGTDLCQSISPCEDLPTASLCESVPPCEDLDTGLCHSAPPVAIVFDEELVSGGEEPDVGVTLWFTVYNALGQPAAGWEYKATAIPALPLEDIPIYFRNTDSQGRGFVNWWTPGDWLARPIEVTFTVTMSDNPAATATAVRIWTPDLDDGPAVPLECFLKSVTDPAVVQNPETAVVFETPVHLTQFVEVARQEELEVVALEHSGRTRGGVRFGSGGLDRGIHMYRDMLREVQGSSPHIFSARVTGAATALDFGSLAESIVDLEVVDASDSVIVFPPGTRSDQIHTMGPEAELDESEDSTLDFTTDSTNTWAPVSGSVHGYDSPLDPDKPRVMSHRLEWTSQDDIDDFGCNAYEHDFKLRFVPDPTQLNPFGCLPYMPVNSEENFWATRGGLLEEGLFDAVAMDTTLPPETGPYLDTWVGDNCNIMDFTVGMYEPINLVPGEYSITVRAPAGGVSSSNYGLRAELINKICSVHNPWCVSGVLDTEFLVRKREGMTVPGCREWQRFATSSTACSS